MRNLTLAFVVGALLVGLFAAPAAGYTVKGTGLFARFAGGTTEGTGIFMVDRTGSSNPRLHGVFVGLLPYIEQDAVFRSIGCGGTPSPANRVFSVHGVADGNGDLTYNRPLSPSIDFGAIRSVWIDVDQTPTCAISFNFEKIGVAAGDVNGDGAAGLVRNNSGSFTAMTLVERRTNGKARLTIVINAGEGNDEISVRGVNKPCGVSPTHTAFTVEIAGHGFKSRIVGMSQAEINGLRSMRVRNLSTGQSWCAPLSIIAILIGG